jgi:T5SS/PEP-CTERM-associated repeat protein
MRPLALVFVLMTCVAPAHAAVTTTGDIVPGGAATQPDPWAVAGSLEVGVSGNGTLNVEAGGTVSNTKGYIGYQAGSTGEATVTGTDSQWTNSGELNVGVVSHGTLNVEAGGTVSNTTGRIGYHADSTGNVTVTGMNSQWNNSDRLVVGRSGNGTLIVEAEGRVSNSLGLIGRYAGSTGVVTISGANSQWNNSGGLHVGWYGDGTLDVKAGSMVFNTSGYIGRYSGSTGMATVTGADSQWNSSNSLTIGGGSSGAGGSGTLNIRDTGLVTVSDTTRLWDEGTIVLDGGTLDTVTLDLTVGTLNMLDGILRATNVTGTLHNQGATLSPGNSPGHLTITGDYTQGAAATMEIELAGTAADDFDQLTSAGSANLDGTLNLPVPTYTDPSVRGTSDEFVIITGGVRSGTFSTVQYAGSTLAADFGTDVSGSFRSDQGGGLFRSVFYTATTVQLQNLLALAGDTDGDQDVDLEDFSSLANHFDPSGTGVSTSWKHGNSDGDNDVDLADYNALAGKFAPAGYGTAAVPEPCAALLALLATALLGASGRPLSVK